MELLSFEKFYHNVFEVGAVLDDKNKWTTNYIGHPYEGSEYYLYFRSRGYSPKMAFLHMTISSTMFELAVETFHKPLSTIDFVVTPVLGGPLGWWREIKGLQLVNSDKKYHRVIGHILYLETNLWFFEEAHISPAISLEPGFTGFNLYARF